jgi:hypothetical protein
VGGDVVDIQLVVVDIHGGERRTCRRAAQGAVGADELPGDDPADVDAARVRELHHPRIYYYDALVL